MFKRVLQRQPDLIIYKDDGVYLRRWHILPRNKFPINIYLHHFLQDDEARALHDHPWPSLSIILKGGYIEHVFKKGEPKWVKRRKLFDSDPGGEVSNTRQLIRHPGQFIWRKADLAHRIEMHKERGNTQYDWAPEAAAMGLGKKEYHEWVKYKPAWTIFITFGYQRKWGFHCPQGWRPHDEFNDPKNPGRVGKGCA